MQLTYGYLGRVIEVDLDTGTYQKVPMKESDYRKYLGGSGLGGKLLYSDFDHKVDPLSGENPLIFMAGILTGTPVPTSAKCSVVTKSPLTGIWGEATVGGYWGPELKKAGYDGIIIKGKSSRPVVLYINDEDIRLIEAEDLWGKDVYQTEEELKERTHEKAEVACIGPAGENLVKIAGIMVGGRETRAAGRCGVGAVMGSKKLKAVVVRGSNQVPVYDKQKLTVLIKEFMPELKENTRGLYDYGTAGGVQAVEANGDLPIRNWTLGSWEEGAAKTCGQRIAQTVQVGHYACYACPIRCGKDVEVRVGPYKGSVGHGPEYETCAAFGSNILNEDLDYLCAANDLCNRYGLDTISTGNVIAMAIECYENGLISKEDTGGIELGWGDGEAVLELIKKIAFKEDIGRVLSEGVKKAADHIGGLAHEYAVHTKGLSYAFHDPRAFTSMAANYATGNRGACHLEALSYFAEGGAFPPELIGFTKKIDPHGYEHKGELAARMQDFMNLFNALGLCKFLIRGKTGPEIIKDWVNAATGWDMTVEELMLTGERLHNLKRMYNVRLGISRKDDVLPPRLLVHDRKTGRAGGSLPHIGRILYDYYQFRGWSTEGIPTDKKLKELGLDELVNNSG